MSTLAFRIPRRLRILLWAVWSVQAAGLIGAGVIVGHFLT